MNTSRVPPATTEQDSEFESSFGFSLPDESWLAALRAAVAPVAGLRVGPYELLGEVRRGAQGLVLRARQPHTQRTIALKRLARGQWSTPDERARFEREIEAAVSLNHPNIVVALGVEYVDGQPLLAMEWIDGLPIDQWRNGLPDNRRTITEILLVYQKVCDAVHHAHQRGVIHRDLKPGNILVVSSATALSDRPPEPKVLDFGLAKRIEDFAAGDQRTASAAFLGTPAYAAPEQISGHANSVDVRTDVYALGVILYELLVGRLPFDPASGVATLFDAIRAGEPTAPARLSQLVDADLDAIVRKALAREPARRYASVDALSTDLRRYLAKDPVEARRGQRWYAASKLLRRYWLGAAVTGFFLLLVSTAAVGLSILYARQGHMLAQVSASHDAEAEARRNSERVQRALERLLVQVAELGKGSDMALRRDILADAVRMVDDELNDAPVAKARALGAIGRTFQQLALYDDAERCLRTALEMIIVSFGRRSIETAAALNDLGELLQDRSRGAAAEPLFREALELRTTLLGHEHPDVAESLQNLGGVLSNRQEHAEALHYYQAAFDMRRRLLGAHHPDTLASLALVSCAYLNLNDPDAAETAICMVLADAREVLGPEHRDTAAYLIELGKALLARGALDEAEECLRKSLAIYRNLFGDRHDNVAWAAHRLGTLLHARGDFAGAEDLLCEARKTYQDVLGPDSVFVAFVNESLAELFSDVGRDAEAAEARSAAERIRVAYNVSRASQ